MGANQVILGGDILKISTHYPALLPVRFNCEMHYSCNLPLPLPVWWVGGRDVSEITSLSEPWTVRKPLLSLLFVLAGLRSSEIIHVACAVCLSADSFS